MPLVTTRGYVLVNESGELIKEIELLAKKIVIQKLKTKNVNFTDMKTELVNNLMPFLEEKTGRIPIILPIFMDVKRK
jgi:ribonuclease J